MSNPGMERAMERMRAQEDHEANIFAMELLLPEPMVREAISKIGGRINFTDDAPLAAIAKEFGVTLTLLVLRLVQLKPEIVP